jgi:hypothetical protein
MKNSKSLDDLHKSFSLEHSQSQFYPLPKFRPSLLGIQFISFRHFWPAYTKVNVCSSHVGGNVSTWDHSSIHSADWTHRLLSADGPGKAFLVCESLQTEIVPVTEEVLLCLPKAGDISLDLFATYAMPSKLLDDIQALS